MSNPLLRWIAALALLLAGGCKTLPEKPTPKPQAVAPPPRPLPFKHQVEPPKELDSEALFDYLSGEIGIQRGDRKAAYEHLLQAARSTRDPVAAAQATQIALSMNKLPLAAQATDLWIQNAPNAIRAREVRTLLALKQGDMKEAAKQAEAVLRIADALGKDGFEALATVLATEKSPSKLSLMETLANKNARDARAHYALALVAAQLKRFPLAEQALQQASLLKPQWDKPHLLRSRLLLLNHQQAEAEQYLAKTVKTHPSPTLYQALGQIRTQQKRYKDALTAYQQALKLKPDDPDLLSAIGLLAMQTKDLALARQSWQRLAGKGSYDNKQEAWYFLGQVEELEKHPDKAMAFYRKVESGRLVSDARLRLAILTARQGDLDHAEALFRELRLTNPAQAVRIYVTEAQLYKELGKETRAMRVYDEAVAANPHNTDLLYARGLLAADMGQVAKAEQDFKAVLKLQPGDADALNALGYTLAEQTNRLKEAYGYISQALKKLPDNAAVMDSMGWVLYRMGHKQEALGYLQKAAAKMKDGEIAAHLGEVLWSLGRKDDARKVWQEALKFAPNNKKLKQTIQRHR